MPTENFAYKIFFGKNAQPLSEASPRGETLPRSGGDEEKLAFLFCLKICLLRNFQTKGQLHFRKLENIRKQAAPLDFQKFLPKYSENQKCATPLIRFAFARHLPPKGKAFLLPYFKASPSGKLSTKLTEEVLSSIGKTSLTLDFATLLAEIAFKRQFGKVFPKGGKQELSPYFSPLRSACRAAISFSYPRPFGV